MIKREIEISDFWLIFTPLLLFVRHAIYKQPHFNKPRGKGLAFQCSWLGLSDTNFKKSVFPPVQPQQAKVYSVRITIQEYNSCSRTNCMLGLPLGLASSAGLWRECRRPDTTDCLRHSQKYWIFSRNLTSLKWIYGGTSINDHLQRATTCSKTAKNSGPDWNYNDFNVKQPLRNGHLSTPYKRAAF